MKFTISTGELLRAVNACSKVISSKNSLAILDDVLLSEKDGIFFLTGSNSDQRYRTTLSSFKLTEGEFKPFCLPAKLLQQSLGTLTDETLAIDIEETGMTVKYNGGKFSTSVMNADEYPQALDIVEGGIQFTADTETFIAVMKRANALTANDELRPIMNGVLLDLHADGYSIVGTDGHRLYKYDMPDMNEGYLIGQPCQVVVPKTLVPALEGLDADDVLTIRADDKQVQFSNADTTITGRLIEGRYPNYNSVIPQDSPTTLTVNCKDFIKAVKRISVFAPTTSLLILQERHDLIYLSTEDIDFGHSSEEQMKVVGHNLPAGLRVGFNYNSMIACLQNIATENVVLHFTDPSRAVKYTAEDGDPTVMIQMPMLIG